VAAIAAARTSARPALVERWGYLAGCLTGTYNTSVATFGDSDNKQVIRGIPWEFIERMEQAGAATCMALGHTTGTAAALAAQGDGTARAPDLEAMQRILQEQDVVLSAQ
jgi:hypothetical protein